MKRKIKSGLVSAAFYCMLLVGPVLAAQGTDGTELQALEAQTLTIRLGPAWAGTRFQLSTDIGPYPGTVDVGDDGVLRMEIGGSGAYELVCLDETTSVQKPGETNAGEMEPGETETSEAETETGTAQAGTEDTINESESSPAIPALHIALFIGSMLSVLGIFIYAHVAKTRREAGYDDDDDGEI